MSKKLLFEEIEFEVEKEVWNTYELEDGNERVTLKIRSILTKIIKPRIMCADNMPMIGVPEGFQPPRKLPQEELNMTFQNIVVVSNCPSNLMGEPSTPVSPNEFQQLPNEEVPFTPFSEDWNVYNICSSGQKIKIKLVVSSISKMTGKYDQFGYPIYVVQTTNAVAPVLSKKK